MLESSLSGKTDDSEVFDNDDDNDENNENKKTFLTQEEIKAELKINNIIGDDLDAHEIITHPAEGVLAQQGKNIEFLNKSKSVEDEGMLYFQNRIIETKDQNGNKVYILPGLPKAEANTVEMEEIVRNNANSNPENRRVYYDIKDIINYSKVFRTKKEVENFFK